MKTFVINLKRRQDRLKEFEEANASRLSGYEVYEAIDGNTLTYENLRKAGFDTDKDWRDPNLKRVLTWGEVGCFVSHYALWETCSKGDEPFLILEDDVVFTDDLGDIEGDLNGHDLLFLAYSEQKKGGVKKVNESLVKPCYPYWLAAYVLTPAGARKLVETDISSRIIPCDEYVPRMLDRLDAVGRIVQPCHQRKREDAGTDIEPTSESAYIRDFTTHVLTCGDNEEKTQLLLNSAVRVGINFTNVLSRDWKGGTMEGPGGGQKINEILRYIEEKEVPDHDVILFADAHDVVITQGLEDILGRYLGYKRELVFGAEQFLWPDKTLEFPPSHTKYRYLNSGTWIGRVGEFKRMCAGGIKDHEDDQLFLQRAYLSGRYNACLDVEGYLFQTHEPSVIIKNGAIFNPITRCYTCLYHGNGGHEAKAKLNELWTKLTAHEKYIQVRDHKVIGQDMILIDFMTPAQCAEWIQISEKHGGWNPHPDDRFPSHDIHLKELGLFEEIEMHWRRVIAPICERFWRPYSHYHLRKAFTMKYSADTQKTLGLHTDASLVTGSVKLNDDYDGATLVFPRQDVTNQDIPIGKMILFPGQVTHGHHVTTLERGTKYSATFWTARYKDDTLDP